MSCALLLLPLIGFSAGVNRAPRIYELWEPAPAPNRGHDMWIITNRGYGYDKDWEEWSYPIGNGTMGANIFGRVDTERVQITEKTIHNIGVYNRGGLTGFANIFLDFNHENVSGYRRSLNLNDAIAHVSYQAGDVKYTRQYFMSYPDNVLVIRLDANKKGALSFTVRPEIAYLDQEDRTGSVTATNDLITLAGHMPYLDINFEGQLKVLNQGGSLQSEDGKIKVSGADSVTLIFAAGTNYKLSEKVFRPYPENKLDPNQFPHDEVSARIASAAEKGFAALKAEHLKDYQNLFGRVALDLNSKPSELPTHELLYNYRFNQKDTWLEELVFQHARYMLIASSRENTLPANLQGTWSQYYFTPWTGGFWHNINIQMNYWGAMSANLAETFVAYINFYKAYLPRAQELATEYVRKYAPDKLSDEPGGNGWVIGSGANAYFIPPAAESHSGPGTGGLTAKLFMDYFDFTQDKTYLEETGYPVMLGISRFFSKALRSEPDGTLLVYPSASPEIRVMDTNQIQNIENPGKVLDRGYYITKGCTFDQSAIWESFKDTLAAADALGKKDEFLNTIGEDMPRLDPILIGSSGQIKEFREEDYYGNIGDPKHRHISQLVGLYPFTLINPEHPDWMAAASKTLDLRGNNTTGWALAHRMNARARLKEGEKAHVLLDKFITERTVQNLWALHPPFQIDGSLGVMAGTGEMLLQSHEGYIDLLPALPKAWSAHGHFRGLVARGNFVVSAKWKHGKATIATITSRAGGDCRIHCPGIEEALIKDQNDRPVQIESVQKDLIRFTSVKGETYRIIF